MLDKDPDLASRYASDLRAVIDAVGLRSKVSKDRLAEIKRLFEHTGSREPSRGSLLDEVTVAGRCSPMRPEARSTLELVR